MTTPVVLHRCHAMGCDVAVPPRMLMCVRHWRMVPLGQQRAVWRNYRPGQERDKSPSARYLECAKEAIRSVAIREGRIKPEPPPAAAERAS